MSETSLCGVCRKRPVISIPDNMCATCILKLPGYAQAMADQRVEQLEFWEVVHA